MGAVKKQVDEAVDKTVDVAKGVGDATVDITKNVGGEVLDVVDTVVVDPIVGAGQMIDEKTGAGKAVQKAGEAVETALDVPGFVEDVAGGQAKRAAEERFKKLQQSRESAEQLKARKAQRLYGKNRGGNGTLLTGPLGVQGTADVRKKTLLGQ